METIFFFDGNCGFCNRTVLYLLDRTPEELKFCPLQSDYAKEKLSHCKIDMSTAYFLNEDKVYQKSSAILESFALINPQFKYFKNLCSLFPVKLRDYIYDKFSKNRLKITTPKCRLLNNEERKRFIH